MYNTGDFLDDYAVDPNLRNDWSFAFLVEVDQEGLRRMRSLCAAFNTHTIATPEGLEVKLR